MKSKTLRLRTALANDDISDAVPGRATQSYLNVPQRRSVRLKPLKARDLALCSPALSDHQVQSRGIVSNSRLTSVRESGFHPEPEAGGRASSESRPKEENSPKRKIGEEAPSLYARIRPVNSQSLISSATYLGGHHVGESR